MRHCHKPRIYVTQMPSAARMVVGGIFAVANKRHQFRLMSLIASEILKIAQVFAMIYRKKL